MGLDQRTNRYSRSLKSNIEKLIRVTLLIKSNQSFKEIIQNAIKSMNIFLDYLLFWVYLFIKTVN